MGKEYSKVLKALGVNTVAVCRSVESATSFERDTGIHTISGGCENAIKELKELPEIAIVAVSADQLAQTTIMLMENGVKRVLVEKPAGMNREELLSICNVKSRKNGNVFVAYNRRFYASTEKALEIIENDGGVESFNFEFTEWGHVVEQTNHPLAIKERWLLANSSHVIDLAFFLGGHPIELSAYRAGSLPWHSTGSIYAGAGITEKGALFSYQANWNAPGRWALEILTSEHRLYFRPMEKLSIQNKGTVKVEEMILDDQKDRDYKPGLYMQVQSFLENDNDPRLITVDDQLRHIDYYEKIAGII